MKNLTIDVKQTEDFKKWFDKLPVFIISYPSGTFDLLQRAFKAGFEAGVEWSDEQERL